MSSFKYAYIYLTKNIRNGMKYVGYHRTNNLYEDYYIGSGKYLQRAIKKYGRENFINGIIEFCSVDSIKEKEKFWINKLNTKAPYGYNLTEGGDGLFGYKHTQETKRKIGNKSGWNRGLKNVYLPETIKKMSNSHLGLRKGKTHNDDTKLKMSKSHIGKKLSDEHRKNISKFAKGKTWEERYGEEIANKMRETRKKKKQEKIKF